MHGSKMFRKHRLSPSRGGTGNRACCAIGTRRYSAASPQFGASGTVPLTSRSTGRVVDIRSSPTHTAHQTLAHCPWHLGPSSLRLEAAARLGWWKLFGHLTGFQQHTHAWQASSWGDDHEEPAGAKAGASKPFDRRISSGDRACLGSGSAAPCLIVKYGTWYELRLGVVRWQRL